jgi:hypothetical protein
VYTRPMNLVSAVCRTLVFPGVYYRRFGFLKNVCESSNHNRCKCQLEAFIIVIIIIQ